MRCRKSIVTGRTIPEQQLVRFVEDPAARVIADVGAKLPGRGAWVEASRAHIETALRKNLFARSFKHSVTADPALGDQVEQQLVARILSLVGLARKAGSLGVGLEAVIRDLGSLKSSDRRQVWLFEASDGRAENRQRVLAPLLAPISAPTSANGAAECSPGETGGKINVVGCFTSSELGLALGRDNVVHAVLKDDGIGSKLTVEVARLAGFRELVPSGWKINERLIPVCGDQEL